MVFVAAMQDHEKTSLTETLRTLRPRMLTILRLNGVRPGEADDLIQETALAAILQWERIRNLEAWFLIVLRNRARDSARRRCRDPALAVGLSTDLDHLGGAVAAPQLAEDDWRDVERLAKTELSPRGWRVLTALCLEGRSATETAAIVRRRETSIRKMYSRARLRLKAAYAAEGTSPKRRT